MQRGGPHLSPKARWHRVSLVSSSDPTSGLKDIMQAGAASLRRFMLCACCALAER